MSKQTNKAAPSVTVGELPDQAQEVLEIPWTPAEAESVADQLDRVSTHLEDRCRQATNDSLDDLSAVCSGLADDIRAALARRDKTAAPSAPAAPLPLAEALKAARAYLDPDYRGSSAEIGAQELADLLGRYAVEARAAEASHKRLTDDEITDRYNAALEAGPRLGNVYRHRKTGRLYAAHAAALTESTLEPVVVYIDLTNGNAWMRPTAEFMERFEPAPKG